MFTRHLERVGAVVLALGGVGFIAVFAYLQSTFSNPDVLERDAAEVLVRLQAGGDTLRSVWLMYGMLPLALAAWFAGIGLGLSWSEQRREGVLCLAVGAVVAVGALRQLSPIFGPIAAVSSLVLPLGLFVAAWMMWRHARPPQDLPLRAA